MRQRGSVGSIERSLLAGSDFVPCGLAATQQRAPVLTNFGNHVQRLFAYYVWKARSEQREIIHRLKKRNRVTYAHRSMSVLSIKKINRKKYHLKKSLLFRGNEHAIVSNQHRCITSWTTPFTCRPHQTPSRTYYYASGEPLLRHRASVYIIP